MKYEFDLKDWKISGSGENEQEAWRDAIEGLMENCHNLMPDAEDIKEMPEE